MKLQLEAGYWSPVIKHLRNKHTTKRGLRQKHLQLTKKSTAHLKMLKNFLRKDIERLTRSIVIKKEPVSLSEGTENVENQDGENETGIDLHCHLGKGRQKLPKIKLLPRKKRSEKVVKKSRKGKLVPRNKTMLNSDDSYSKPIQKVPKRSLRIKKKLHAEVLHKKCTKCETEHVDQKSSTKVAQIKKILPRKVAHVRKKLRASTKVSHVKKALPKISSGKNKLSATSLVTEGLPEITKGTTEKGVKSTMPKHNPVKGVQKFRIECAVCGHCMEKDDFQWANVIQCDKCKMWTPVYNQIQKQNAQIDHQSGHRAGQEPPAPNLSPQAVRPLLKAFLKPLVAFKHNVVMNDFESSFLPFFNSIQIDSGKIKPQPQLVE